MSSCCSHNKSTCQAGTRRESCPRCGEQGRLVGAETVRAILKPPLAATVEPEERAYRFCSNPDCAVLYFDGNGWSASKTDSLVRVGIKESRDPVPLCYCFGFTRADVASEVAAAGRSTIPARIASLVKAGECACELKNPSGACCLGEVRKAVKEATRVLDRIVRNGGLQ